MSFLYDIMYTLKKKWEEKMMSTDIVCVLLAISK